MPDLLESCNDVILRLGAAHFKRTSQPLTISSLPARQLGHPPPLLYGSIATSLMVDANFASNPNRYCPIPHLCYSNSD